MPTYYSAAWVLFGIFSVPVSCTRFAANLLTQMFMRLGRAEKAGSGVDKIGLAASYCSRGNTSGLCCADLAVRDENPTRKPARKPRKQDLRKEQILEFCVEPQYLSDILQHLGLKDRENLMEVYINPMIGTGVLEMTEPDNPTSRNNGKSGTRTSKVSL